MPDLPDLELVACHVRLKRLEPVEDFAAALVVNALTFGIARCGNALPQDGHVRGESVMPSFPLRGRREPGGDLGNT